jgi:hypothetical protein
MELATEAPIEQDALAIFRQQVKQEQEEKSERSKMSDTALAKLRAIKEQERVDTIFDERFSTALKSVVATPKNLRTLIEQCNTSVPMTDLERRTQKLSWWVAAGFRLGEEIDSVSVINFLSDLTPDERAMTDSRFNSVWTVTSAGRRKESRLARGLMTTDEPVYRPCKSAKKCLRFEKRRPAPAQGKGAYCSTMCGASDRARTKRALATLPPTPTQ